MALGRKESIVGRKALLHVALQGVQSRPSSSILGVHRRLADPGRALIYQPRQLLDSCTAYVLTPSSHLQPAYTTLEDQTSFGRVWRNLIFAALQKEREGFEDLGMNSLGRSKATEQVYDEKCE